MFVMTSENTSRGSSSHDVVIYKSSLGTKDRFLTVQHPSDLLMNKDLAYWNSHIVHPFIKFPQLNGAQFKAFS